MVEQKVALLLIAATSQIEQAKAAAIPIPIIFFLGSDPVENGFVSSLSKPGGNMTGVFNLHSKTTGKRIEALRELVPAATKFAFLTGLGELLGKNEVREARASAQSLWLTPGS